MLRNILAIAAVLFFFSPLALLAAGVEPRAFENRKLSPRPSLQDGWEVFPSTTNFLVDRLPFRDRAVQLNTWKSRTIFRTTPRYGVTAQGALPFEGEAKKPAEKSAPGNAPATASQVSEGIKGWLYLQGDFDRACSPFLPWDEAVGRWERLAKTLRLAGKDVVVVIAPDKSTIYPQFVSKDAIGRDCAKAGKRLLWKRISASGEPRMVGLKSELDSAADDHQIYFKTDSHWNSRGSLSLVEKSISVLNVPGIQFDEDDVTEGKRSRYVGDLSKLLGTSQDELNTPVEFRRDGLGSDPTESSQKLPKGGKLRVLKYSGPQPAQFDRRGLIVHDSFGVGPLPSLIQFFQNVGVGEWYNTRPDDLAVAMAQADVLVLETVEREVTYRAQTILTPAFFARLDRELQAQS